MRLKKRSPGSHPSPLRPAPRIQRPSRHRAGLRGLPILSEPSAEVAVFRRQTRSSAQGNCSAKSLAALVMSSILPYSSNSSLSSLSSTSYAICREGGVQWGGGLAGGGGQGTFHPPCHVLHYHLVLRPEGTSHNNEIPYSPAYKSHPSITRTLKFTLVLWYQVVLKYDKMTHPHFWCSILGQKGVSYTRVDTVCFLCFHKHCWGHATALSTSFASKGLRTCFSLPSRTRMDLSTPTSEQPSFTV